MTAVQERYAVVDRMRIRVLERGRGSPVLLLHGLGGVAEEWLPVMETLEDRHHLIAPDLPGFGLSDKPEVPYTPRFFARAARDLVAALGCPVVAVVGHSMGGGVGLEMAASCAEVCRRLVLLAPAGLSRKVGLGVRLLATPLVGELALRRRRRRKPDPPSQVTGQPEDIRDILRAVKRRMRETAGWRAALLGTVRASVTPLGLRAGVLARARAVAPTLRLPTLILWGDRDRVVPLGTSVWIRDTLPDCRMVVLEGLGHDTHLEDPARTGALIREFLAD